jgi:tetratricopeptide (TPR) repeat protein
MRLALSIVVIGVCIAWGVDHAMNQTLSPSTPPLSQAMSQATPDATPSATPTAIQSPALTAEQLALTQNVRKLFDERKFAEAYQALQLIFKQYPSQDPIYQWAQKQKHHILIAMGWSALNAGRCEEAIEHLSLADQINQTLESTKGLAFCYYKIKNIPGASEKLRTYTSQKPDDISMQLVYVDVLESDERFSEATRILSDLNQKAGAKDTASDVTSVISLEELKKRLAAMQAKLRESAQQGRLGSRNFIVVYRSQNHGEVAQRALDILESALDEFIQTFQFDEPKSVIEVVLYPSAEFSKLSGGPAWADGLFDGRLRIPVSEEALQRWPRIIRHELVHALLALRSNFRHIPPWFNEGLAQRLECTRDESCYVQKRWNFQDGFLDKIDFNKPFIALDSAKAQRAYEQSLYLMLTLEKQHGEEALRRILTKIQPNSSLSSDQIINQSQLTFDGLVHSAKSNWQSRQSPTLP